MLNAIYVKALALLSSIRRSEDQEDPPRCPLLQPDDRNKFKPSHNDLNDRSKYPDATHVRIIENGVTTLICLRNLRVYQDEGNGSNFVGLLVKPLDPSCYEIKLRNKVCRPIPSDVCEEIRTKLRSR